MSVVHTRQIKEVNPKWPGRNDNMKFTNAPDTNNNTYETRKLLAYLLKQLEERDLPADPLQRAATISRKGFASDVVYAGGTLDRARPVDSYMLSHETAETVGERSGNRLVRPDPDPRSHEILCDLVDQVRRILVIAARQNLDLFEDTAPQSLLEYAHVQPNLDGTVSTLPQESLPGPKIIETRTRGQSIGVTGTSAGNLIERMVNLLRVLFLVDAQYQIAAFRLRNPPNVVQGSCLDIATYLYHVSGLSTRLDIVELVIAALPNSPIAMREPILAWLEGRVREQLKLCTGSALSLPRFFGRDAGDTLLHEPKPVEVNISDDFGHAHSSHEDHQRVIDLSRGWNNTVDARRRDALLATSSLGIRIVERIGSMISDLLGALLETINLAASTLTTLHRYHRLLSVILTGEHDTALDLLSIVAYSPGPSKRTAAEILSTFFPNMVGHNAIALELPLHTYQEHRIRWETGRDDSEKQESERHVYHSWHSNAGLGDSVTPRCSHCKRVINGFCVRCSLCGDLLHADCYRSDTILPAEATHDGDTSSYDSAKYSQLLPRLEEQTINSSSTRDGPNATVRIIGKHTLHLANIFSTRLCTACQWPLWGTAAQGYACTSGCGRVVHKRCVDALSSTNRLLVCEHENTPTRGRTFTVSELAASFAEVRGTLTPFTDDRSILEVTILWTAAWLQQQLFERGAKEGAFQVASSAGQIQDDPLGLTQALRCYEEWLDSNLPSASEESVTEPFGLHRGLVRDQLFSPRSMTQLAGQLRSSLSRMNNPGGSSSGSDMSAAMAGFQIQHHVLDVKDSFARRFLIVHLQNLGLVSLTGSSDLESETDLSGVRLSLDPVLGNDHASTAGILLPAIQALLADVDLALNEQGLSLLFTKAYPDMLRGPAVTLRAAKSLLSWVLDEGSALVSIVERFASRKTRLPGVRPVSDGTSRSSTSVSHYKEARARLRQRYALPWLAACHEQSPVFYAKALYDASASIESSSLAGLDGRSLEYRTASSIMDRVTLVFEAGLGFTTKLRLMTTWFNSISLLIDNDHAYRALPRILAQDGTQSEESADIWALLATVGPQSIEPSEAVRWLRVLAVSGVRIPWEMTDHFLSSLSTTKALQDLAVAIRANSNPTAPQHYANTCARLVMSTIKTIGGPNSGRPDTAADTLLREALAIMLDTLGVPLEDMRVTFVPHDFIQNYKITRQPNRQPVEVDPHMILAVIELLEPGTQWSDLVLDFLWLTFGRSMAVINSGLAAYELAPRLMTQVWPLWDCQTSSNVRLKLTLRLIAVRLDFFKEFIAGQLLIDKSLTEQRLLSLVVESAEELSSVDTEDMRIPAVEPVLLLFDSILRRTEVSSEHLALLPSFLPAHLSVVSTCLAENLIRASDERRLGILDMVAKVQRFMPTWGILPWTVIEAILTEQSTSVKQLAQSQTRQAVAALFDAQTLQSCSIALGLRMLASGVEITWNEAQTFQQHVASIITPPWAVRTDDFFRTIIPPLRLVMDSSERLVIGGQTGRTALIGALFLSTVVNFGNELRKRDSHIQQGILDILMATFFKQNIEPVELAATGALQTLADFSSTSATAENRLLAIQIVQIALTRMPAMKIIRASPTLFSVMAQVHLAESSSGGDGAIAKQAQLVLRTLGSMFGDSGLFTQVFKNEAVARGWSQQNSSLVPALQLLVEQDVPSTSSTTQPLMDSIFLNLSDLFRRDRETLQQAIAIYADFVAALGITLSADATQNFGSFITRLAKHVVEWAIDEFDPNAALGCCSSMLRLSVKETAQTLLYQISTFLQMSLMTFAVDDEILFQLQKAAQAIVSREKGMNTVQQVILDVLGSVLSGAACSPVTMKTLLAATQRMVRSTAVTGSNPLEVSPNGPGLVAILSRQHTVFSSAVDAELTVEIVQLVSELLLEEGNENPDGLGMALSRYFDGPVVLQSDIFSSLLFAAITSDDIKIQSNISALFPLVIRTISSALRVSSDYLSVQDIAGEGAELLTCTFVLLRLLVVFIMETGHEDSRVMELGDLWLRIWPDWSRLLSLSLEVTTINGPLRGVAQSAFLDLIIFLSVVQAPILISCKRPISQALERFSEWVESTGSSGRQGKLIRARSIVESGPPSSVSVDIKPIIRDIKGDMLAVERLRSLKIALRAQ